jgi:hypothetical protein
MRKLLHLAIATLAACASPMPEPDVPTLDAVDMAPPAADMSPKFGRIISHVMFHTNPDGTRADMGRIQYDTELHSIVTLGYERHGRLAWLPTDSFVPVRRLSEAPPAAHSASARVFLDAACSVPFAITGLTVKPRYLWQTIAEDSIGLPAATAVYAIGNQIDPGMLWTLSSGGSGGCIPMTATQSALFAKNRAFW